MKIALSPCPMEQTLADAIVIPVFEDEKETRFGADKLYASEEVTGKPLEHTLLHNVPGDSAGRILLAGVGKKEGFDANEARKAAGAVVRFLKPKSIKNIAFALEQKYQTPDYAADAVEGAIRGDFEPDRHKTGNDKKSV